MRFVDIFVGCDLVDGFGSLHPTVISSFLQGITVDRFVVAISDWCTMICGGPLYCGWHSGVRPSLVAKFFAK